jgi:hypothetical protein
MMRMLAWIAQTAIAKATKPRKMLILTASNILTLRVAAASCSVCHSELNAP